MSEEIRQLEPRVVWNHFYSLTRIPRPSGHEDAIRSFIADFGRALGLETILDGAGNVIIRKPATPGMEDRKGVILQAHLDMVPQKNSGTDHDFERDAIEPIIDGEWVRACGTTLGADNGIGVAAAMAVLESSTLRHGPVEALFTSEEETGMVGATGLQPAMLRGEMLLNLDSEDEGELFIGCAGGLDGTITIRYAETALPADYTGFSLRVSGLRGGHSGMDIHLGRGNANKIMNRLLLAGHRNHGLLLAEIEGGSLRNAIPRESAAWVAVPAAHAEVFLQNFTAQAAKIQAEFSGADPSLHIEALPASTPPRVIEEGVFVRSLKAIHASPNGVMRMSCEIEGLVETSSNLAIVKSLDSALVVHYLLRSSIDSALEDLASMIASLFELTGAEVVFGGGYPGWKPEPASPVLALMREVYRLKFGREAEVRAVHAGLECGIIGATYPDLDMISFGPTIRYPHSPDEKVEIASVARFWAILAETLFRIPLRLSVPQ
ncbi:MAG: aminoacyl-histidine dipeptidase [Chlorobium sp.]|uniref:aminoacyl-histidine dipeptidase n=1 Tax=Chlorobium sp. TaxID=1095 RepID=UPI0025C6EBCD|nr:aminoacyl-histidine dipeptidase [Chlorobium sp.]MCF8217212.1 aminoacyl-histidine dipeptidase [Chlorobium sp.]MCF8272055.1 aminoacyl-histidine dipeptidase [Chlorobium sp.]MCF8288431.1 aminoacyl-histidine dipeptidase [Chlorobium sp.]MCF8292021.1 aminoacyl-histidine dipeptidase [Chlorobium sp.]MCF8386123.1 aminoacyl-histidine dipeptidase [Chlorobium sp.]